MSIGKSKCMMLKKIRKAIADANDIKYVVEECSFKGNCTGTCPKCEAELRYIEEQLHQRQLLGKAVMVAGLSLAVSMPTLAAPDNNLQVTNDSVPQIEKVIKTGKYVIRGTVRDELDVLMYANVTIRNDSNRIVAHTVSDTIGQFWIPVDSLPVKVRVSFIGCRTKTITVTEENYQNVNVNLTTGMMTTGIGVYMLEANLDIRDEDGKIPEKAYAVFDNGEVSELRKTSEGHFYVASYSSKKFKLHVNGYKPVTLTRKKCRTVFHEPVKVQIKKTRRW